MTHLIALSFYASCYYEIFKGIVLYKHSTNEQIPLNEVRYVSFTPNYMLNSIVLIFFSFFQELILVMFVLVFYEKRFVAIKSVTFKYANNICKNGVKLDYSKFESKAPN